MAQSKENVRKVTEKDNEAEMPSASVSKSAPRKKSTASATKRTTVKPAADPVVAEGEASPAGAPTSTARKRTATSRKKPSSAASRESQSDVTKPHAEAAQAENVAEAVTVQPPVGEQPFADGGDQAPASEPVSDGTKTFDGTSDPAQPKKAMNDTQEGEYVPRKEEEQERGSQATEEPPAINTELFPVPTENGERDVSPVPPGVRFPADAKQRFFSRLLFLLAVVAVFAASFLIFLYRPATYTERVNAVNFLYRQQDGVTVVVVNGAVRGEVTGEVGAHSYSAKGDVCVATVGGVLYLIDGSDVIKLADGVTDFVLASKGNAVAYRTAPGNLYYRTFDKDAVASLISQTTYDARYCISPNGKELAYTWQHEDGSIRLDIESRSGSKPYIAAVTGLYPVAIGDKCRHIYYTDEAGVLYHLDAKTDVRTECSATPDMSTLLFNDDFSQLLFRDEGGTVLMANGSRRTLNGIDVGDALHFLPNHRITARELPRAAQCMVGTFYKNYFLREREGHTELVFLDKEGSVKTVSSVDGASKVTVTDKGVFFLLTETESGEDHTKLYYAKYGKTELSVIAWDIQSFCPNVDGSRVLYTNQHGALFSYRHGGVPVRLCDSIKVDSLVVSADDVFYFYTTDGALCLSDNGEEMRTVFEEPAELLVDSHTVYFITEKQSDGTATVFVNYRNRRLNTLLSSGIARVE